MYCFKKYDIAEMTKITYKNDTSGGVEDYVNVLETTQSSDG